MFNHDAVCVPLAALDSELEKRQHARFTSTALLVLSYLSSGTLVGLFGWYSFACQSSALQDRYKVKASDLQLVFSLFLK